MTTELRIELHIPTDMPADQRRQLVEELHKLRAAHGSPDSTVPLPAQAAHELAEELAAVMAAWGERGYAIVRQHPDRTVIGRYEATWDGPVAWVVPPPVEAVLAELHRDAVELGVMA